ncbi:MAG: hypothetical protein O3A01_03930 [bacterium]|nr:hypothetical protein [bacterium]
MKRLWICLAFILVVSLPVFAKFDYTDYSPEQEGDIAYDYPNEAETEYYDDGKYGVILPSDIHDAARYPYYLQVVGESLDRMYKYRKAYMDYSLNANTPGYKKFKVESRNVKGHIIPIKYHHWGKGLFVQSWRTLDFALGGKYSFFTVRMPNGSLAYTQDGRMRLESDGQLVTIAYRLPVLGEAGPIYLENDDVAVRPDGSIYDHEGKVVDRFRITSFENAKGLWGYQGTVFFIKDPNVTTPLPDGAGNFGIVQGYYEGSNENAGTGSGKLDTSFYIALSRATKHILDSYEVMYRAVGPDR